MRRQFLKSCSVGLHKHRIIKFLVMGIDQWGWDLPFHGQFAKSRATNDNTLFWEAHRVGQRRPYGTWSNSLT